MTRKSSKRGPNGTSNEDGPNTLLSNRKRLLAVKREVQRWLGPLPADVRREAAKYRKELQAPYKRSTKRELLDAIQKSSIVFGGDFHAFAQAQRTHLKLLRSLEPTANVAVAFECLPADKQKLVDRYQRGEIESGELRKKLCWDQTWGFPWAHYEPLFELARARSWKILCLGTGAERSKSLNERDRLAAAVLARAHRKDPKTLIYVLFGELHLANSNLPRAYRRAVSNHLEVRDLRIHLNPEKIYFDLAETGLEHETDVVRFDRGDFAVLVSPPWIQWQNYLLFLETTLAEERSDADYTDSLAGLIRMGDVDFGLQTRVDDFELVTSGVKANLRRQLGRLPEPIREIAKNKVSEERSFFVPSRAGSSMAFLGGPSLNHLALLAGHAIFAQTIGLRRPLWKGRAEFKELIWAEAVAYFFSKQINHKRQTDSYLDLQSRYEMLSDSSMQKDALKIALVHALNELLVSRGLRPRPLNLRPRHKSSWAEAARIVGEMMGEKLYNAYRSRKLNKQDVLRAIQQDPLSPSFDSFFNGMVRLLSAAALQPRSRAERL